MWESLCGGLGVFVRKKLFFVFLFFPLILCPVCVDVPDCVLCVLCARMREFCA